MAERRDLPRLVFPAVVLLYLSRTVRGIDRYAASDALAVVGYVALVAFGVLYLVAVAAALRGDRRQAWLLLSALVGLAAIDVAIAREDGFIMFLLVAIVAIGLLRLWSIPVVVALAVSALVLPAIVPSWDDGLDVDDAFTIVLTSIAMFGVFEVLRANVELRKARAEIARLAAEGERARIARDLHDLLGHSLTTITLKAGLARRLADRDPARAAVEIGEVEALARGALTDVRAAVANYREVTLRGELATAREVLRAAGVAARLPADLDTVDSPNGELFGWTVREGVTNVVKHANARTCTVSLGPTWLQVTDDGVGHADRGPGSGLAGLRERAAAVGGRVDAGPRPEGGWCLRVETAPQTTRPAPSAVGETR